MIPSKKLLLSNIKMYIIFFILLYSNSLHATKYYSRGSFNTTDIHSWIDNRTGFGTSPIDFSSSDTFYIQAGHIMYSSRNWKLSGYQSTIIIESRGQLKSIDSINIDSTSFFIIEDNGWYFHMNNSHAPTSIFAGTEVFMPLSNVEILDWKDFKTPITVSIFGNLKISYAPEKDWNQMNHIQLIQNNFILNNHASHAFQFATDSDYTLVVNKNVIIQSGIFNFCDAYIRDYKLSIKGGFVQTGGVVTNASSLPLLGKYTIRFTGDSSFHYIHSGGIYIYNKINYLIDTNCSFYIGQLMGVNINNKFDVYGKLYCDTFKIFGKGSFNLYANAYIYIGADSGISASFQRYGNVAVINKYYSQDANYIYYGKINQFCGEGIPSLVKSLELNLLNSRQFVSSHKSISIYDSLHLLSGIFIPQDTHTLILGISNLNTGFLRVINGFVAGRFARYFKPNMNTGITGLFPIGIDTFYRPNRIEFTTAPIFGGLIRSRFIPIAPIRLGLPLIDGGASLLYTSNVGYWKQEILSGDFTNAIYTGTIYPNLFNDVTDPLVLHLVSRFTSSHWDLDGIHIPSSGTRDFPIVTRYGMIDINEIGVSGTNSFIPLPVTWLDFIVTPLNNDALLNWSTLAEINNEFFEIEKSYNGYDFISIGKINGSINSTTRNDYSFIDKNALTTNHNILYYRIKQIDLDGKIQYSKIQYLKLDVSDLHKINIYPNPTNNFLYINNSIEIKEIFLYNILGKIELYSNHSLSTIDLSSLPKSTYIISVIYIDNTVKNERIIKN